MTRLCGIAFGVSDLLIGICYVLLGVHANVANPEICVIYYMLTVSVLLQGFLIHLMVFRVLRPLSAARLHDVINVADGNELATDESYRNAAGQSDS